MISGRVLITIPEMIKVITQIRKFLLLLPVIFVIAAQLSVAFHFHADAATEHDHCVYCHIATEMQGENLPCVPMVAQQSLSFQPLKKCECPVYSDTGQYSTNTIRAPPVL